MPLSLPSLPTWQQTKTTSKSGFDRVYGYVDKLGAPINRLSNKVGSEAFWPTTLDKESDKAARILRSFCKDGFYVQEEKEDESPIDGQPKGKQRVLKKIPSEVIKNAKGLAIFTTMRTGLWISGAGGSGILMARKADGEWSPPSGILLHTAGLGFLIGVDIYDCVVVINTEKALEAFTKVRCTLGGEVSATAGPVGIGGVMETEVHKRQAPVWNYLKSRGFYAGVQIDGTVIIQRQDENARFYGEKLGVDEILAGKAKRVPPETRGLQMTLKAAQGDKDINEDLLPPAEPTPGDYELHMDESKRFGLPPSGDDPDPYGVKALEEEGMTIKEITPTGQKSRPSIEAFEYKPAPSSPIFNTFNADGTYKRHSKRGSRDSGRLSIASVDRGTQTDVALDSPRFTDSPKDSGHHSPIKKTTENLAEEPEDGDDSSNHEDQSNNEPVIFEKAKIVTIPKRVPPPLPPRNPHRSSQVGSLTSADRPTSPLAASFGNPEDGEQPTGLGIDSVAVSSHSDASPSEALEESKPSGEFDAIHLTSSQDSALEEQLTHIHLNPHQESDRLSPSRRATDDGMSMKSGSSDYSNVVLGGEASDLAIMKTPIEMEDVEGEQSKDKNVTLATAEKSTQGEGDEFHSIPASPVVEPRSRSQSINVAADKEDKKVETEEKEKENEKPKETKLEKEKAGEDDFS